MDPEQVAIERDTRRKIAIVASVFGVLFLFLSIGSGGFAPTPVSTYLLLWIASAIATTIAVAVSYLGRNVLTVAVVQTGLALLTLMFALLFSCDSGAISLGPSGAAGLVGSALVVYSASARVRWTPPFSCA